jgi:integrase
LTLKKKQFNSEEIAIFDEAVIYKRGEFWHFRMWLSGENKYARKSLRTRSESTAIERGRKTYLEIYANTQQNKKYFSITTKEGVELYIRDRQKDVEIGSIKSGRLGTIKTHLQHWLKMVGKETKLKDLETTDCENYYYYRYKVTNGNVKHITIQNEQATINALMKWLFKKSETQIDSFEFKKLPKIDDNNEAVRRSTFTNDEYYKLVKVMRGYAAKKQKHLDANEILTRQIIKHYILIAANSGLRVGEQRQLRWSDVTIEIHKDKSEKDHKYARIHVRGITSKVGKSRIVICRNGSYFERLKGLVKPNHNDALIFSFDGENIISKRTVLYHFHKLVKLSEIDGYETRKIVPYSLRHFMITQRVMSGLGFRAIADMCGTSVTQIERTYYHLNDEIRLTNAKADYRRMPDGTIIIL